MPTPENRSPKHSEEAILLIRLAFVKPGISQYEPGSTTLPTNAAPHVRDDAEAKRCMAPPPLRLYNALVFIDRHFGTPSCASLQPAAKCISGPTPTKIAGQGCPPPAGRRASS